MHVLVMRLEPVAKRGSQHARGGTRCATLHHVMLPIKEISGVPAVERKWLETGKRSENGGGPFPPVTQHIVNAKSALPFRKRIHRHGVPTVKVKIAEPGIRRLRAPRISPCLSVDAAVGGMLPLRFRGERLPCPSRIGRCLSLTHIHRPIQRQRHFVEHGAPEPPIAIPLPEQRMRNSVSSFPVPVIVVPESPSLVAAGRHELEILPVCYFVAIDLKRRNIDRVSFVLIVPTKVFSAPRETQCHDTGRDADHAVNHWRTS